MEDDGSSMPTITSTTPTLAHLARNTATADLPTRRAMLLLGGGHSPVVHYRQLPIREPYDH